MLVDDQVKLSLVKSQDGATIHFTNVTIQLRNETFNGRVISRKCDII